MAWPSSATGCAGRPGDSRALEAAGLLTEAIRETRAPDAVVANNPGQRRWQRIPLSLHFRAVKPAGARP